MEPITWLTIAQIIAQEGLPIAEAVFQKWSKGTPPAQADFDELRGLVTQNAVDAMREQLDKANIPWDSDQGKSMLALVS